MVRPFLVSKVQSRSLQKPILCIVITGAHNSACVHLQCARMTVVRTTRSGQVSKTHMQPLAWCGPHAFLRLHHPSHTKPGWQSSASGSARCLVYTAALRCKQVTWLCGCMADGEPTGEPKGAVVQTIRQVKQFCAGSQYGEGAITFEFAQVQHICPAASHLHAWYCFHGCPWQALMPTAACLKVCQLRQSYSCAVASPSPCSLSELCALCLPHCCPCTCCCVFLLMLCPKPCVVPDLVRYSQGHVIKQ